MDSISAENLRREYLQRGLREADAPADPFIFFDQWLTRAVQHSLDLPNACALATASLDGQPSVRMVLLKERDERGFLVYSNTAGRKAQELAVNPRAALLFYWSPLDRQIRIEGQVEVLTGDQVQAYFHSRPFASQCAAAASRQSTVISREDLQARFEQERLRHASAGQVPLPNDWGGWRLVPASIEFWQGAEHRLHDRLRYRRQGQEWVRERLAP